MILLGPPGAGKGTQAALLVRTRGFRHLASGDLLRQHIADATPLGLLAEPYVRRGDLVPSTVVAALVEEGLRECTGRPVVIDGFPKTARQARQLDGILADAGRRADLALLFEASPDTLLRRLMTRGQGRPDDTAAVIEHRLTEFGRVPDDLTGHYRADGVLRPVRADAEIDAVAAAIAARLPV
ncbi:nucleoside monophosphate kinase [Kitasatospora sp. NPDC058046]|uniref:nucleoside monophosphate kinase n=1 Tax=Kitasatospora sp. NPDC058046 TaxID=3346312 RepID=UPI0036DC7C0C